MKRIDQLADLSREHHQGLVMAQHALRLTADTSPADIRQQWQKLKDYLLQQAATHFQIEEQCLLIPLDSHPQCTDMVIRIQQDHQILRDFAQQPVGNDQTVLHSIGQRLKSHIKYEEKTVFPAAQELLSETQLDAVLAAWAATH